jgi:prolyl-tRNA editing enzyme YbaK/EbsC (Cys-tRNA(Pro) deacylase)
MNLHGSGCTPFGKKRKVVIAIDSDNLVVETISKGGIGQREGGI